MANERNRSPILKDHSPLVLYKTYEEGLLPTPNIRPLRRVIWVPHPVIELEQALQKAKNERKFTLLCESHPCEYEHGINLRFQIGIYGEKIARISADSDESLKMELKDDFSPKTREIYTMLEVQLLKALQDACHSSHLKHKNNRHYRAGERRGKGCNAERNRRTHTEVVPSSNKNPFAADSAAAVALIN